MSILNRYLSGRSLSPGELELIRRAASLLTPDEQTQLFGFNIGDVAYAAWRGDPLVLYSAAFASMPLQGILDVARAEPSLMIDLNRATAWLGVEQSADPMAAFDATSRLILGGFSGMRAGFTVVKAVARKAFSGSVTPGTGPLSSASPLDAKTAALADKSGFTSRVRTYAITPSEVSAITSAAAAGDGAVVIDTIATMAGTQ